MTEAYSYMVDEAPASCPAGTVMILGYPLRWVVAGKGEIHFAVHARPECLPSDGAFTVGQSFTITGGTGIYAGASGSGTVDRALQRTDQGAEGLETWTGTITVPDLEFDLTPPTLSGAAPRVVRAALGARTARVRFTVTARDLVDGVRPVTCKPRSGTRFRLGRTRVTCSAVDTSGNTARTSFTITVRATR